MRNYAWHPHETNMLVEINAHRLNRGTDTLEEAEALVADYVDHYLTILLHNESDDALYLAIYSGLRHTTDQDTWGLASSRIPEGNTIDKIIRFLIALIHEREIGYQSLVELIKTEIHLDPRDNKYDVRYPDSVRPTLRTWARRADKIVEIMDTARSRVGNFTANAEFIRDWALVDLGEEIGVEISAGGNDLIFDYKEGATTTSGKITRNTSAKVRTVPKLKLPPIKDRFNQTDGATITAKNGAVSYAIKDNHGRFGTDIILAKNASRILTVRELAHQVRVRIISPPIVYQEILDITSLNIGVTESVSIEHTFTGLNVNITAKSSDSTKVTVRVNQSQSSLGVTGVAVGTTTITVTGTNPSGSISATFDVTVTVAPIGD